MLKILSLAGLSSMAAALVGLWWIGALFSPSPFVIAVQVFSIALMAWARITFGHRSFHAAADPTAGGIVTAGPYRFIRHPIYAAACLFGWAGIASHISLAAIALGVLLAAGALLRLSCEERLIVARYPEYRDYARRTKRLIPFVY